MNLSVIFTRPYIQCVAGFWIIKNFFSLSCARWSDCSSLILSPDCSSHNLYKQKHCATSPNAMQKVRFTHRVIILLERACLHNRTGSNDANFPDQNVQRHSVTSFETARSLANDPSCGELRGNCSVSYLSFVYGSTGGVCGRSLTVGKILFTGKQTCSLYLVL